MSKKHPRKNEGLQGYLGKVLAQALEFLPDALYRGLSQYFRLEYEGVENLPEKGRALVVANHSDALGYDAFMLALCIAQATKRKPTMMAHRFWFSNDFLDSFSRFFELFPADLKEGLNSLAKDNLVIIFPEGADGNFKISSKMYKLVDFNPGFVPLAIMQNAPVVPAVIMGAEETHFNLGTTDLFKNFIGADVPLPANLIPFPARWKIKFLKPIDLKKYSKKDIKNARFVKEINQNIRYRIQHEIDKELKKRMQAF